MYRTASVGFSLLGTHPKIPDELLESKVFCQAPTQLPTPSPLQVNSNHPRVELEICPIIGFLNYKTK